MSWYWRLFQLPRLEDACTGYLAENIHLVMFSFSFFSSGVFKQDWFTWPDIRPRLSTGNRTSGIIPIPNLISGFIFSFFCINRRTHNLPWNRKFPASKIEFMPARWLCKYGLLILLRAMKPNHKGGKLITNLAANKKWVSKTWSCSCKDAGLLLVNSLSWRAWF